MKEQFPASPEQAIQSAISISISNFNGIFALVAALAKRGLLDTKDIEHLHDGMLNPLNNDGTLPELMALQTRRLDDLCSAVATILAEEPRQE